MAVLAAAPCLAHPVVEALAFEVAGGRRDRGEEPVGAEVVNEVQAVLGRLAGAGRVGAGVLATGGSEDAGPPHRDQEDGVEPVPARRLERGPALDEVLVAKPLGAYLRVALAVEEELSHLLLVEVSMVVQRCEDRHVARSQCGQQLRQLASFGSEVGGRIGFAKQDRPVVDGEGPSAAATMPVRIRGGVRFRRRALRRSLRRTHHAALSS